MSRQPGTEEARPQPGRRKRKRRPPPSAARGWSLGYVLGAYVATLILDFAIARALSHGELKLGLGVVLIDLAMLATLYPLYRRRVFGPRDLGLRSTSAPAAVGLVVLALAVYVGLTAAWNQGVLGHTLNPFHPQLNESLGATVLTGFAIAICAPVVEELFFRGLLYRALRNRMNLVSAAVIAGLLFGAVHASTYPLDSLPPRVVFGVIACLLYERTGSLYPGIALHCLIDGAGLEATISHGSIAVTYLVFIALGVALLIRAAVLSPHRLAVDDATRQRARQSP